MCMRLWNDVKGIRDFRYNCHLFFGGIHERKTDKTEYGIISKGVFNMLIGRAFLLKKGWTKTVKKAAFFID